MAVVSPDPSSLSPGTPVLENYRKWDGSEHWQVEGVLLGTDMWGTWVGFPAGVRMRRPGVDFNVERARVALFPPDQGWAASFWASGRDGASAEIYIDLATTPVWTRGEPLVVTLTDMDLDVIRTFDQTTFIDDEDEFLEHQSLFGYPPDVVARVRTDADRLLESVRLDAAPFDGGTWTPWLGRLAQCNL